MFLSVENICINYLINLHRNHLKCCMKRIILYSCGAIKWYMKKIHSELMKQIHLKTISGLINVLQSLQNVGSVRYHFQLPGGMCHCSFNLWLPATLPSNRRKNKKGWEKGKHSSYFIKSVGNQKAINAEHDFAISLSTDSETEGLGSCNLNS